MKKYKRDRNGIDKKIIVLPCILIIVFVVLLCLVWSEYSKKIMENQKEQLLITAKSLGENMEFSLGEYRNNLNFLSGLKEANKEEVYEQFLASQDGFECNLFLEDKGGQFKEMLRKMHLSNPVFLTRVDDLITIWQYEEEEEKKYLVFKKEMEDGKKFCMAVDEELYYNKLISGIQIGTRGYVMIKNSSGRILMHPEKNQWGIPVIEGRKRYFPDLDYTSLQQMIAEQCSGKTGISEYYSYWWTDPSLPRVKKISAFAPAWLGEDFWVISAVVDYEDFYRPIEKGFRMMTLLFSGTIFLVLLLAIFLGRLLWDRRKAEIEIHTLRELNEKLEEVHKGEEAIAHQQRLQIMGTMTGGIAHEFNNFLTPIMGYAELLMMELPEESEQYESALEIYEASEKAKDVVRQISSLSRKNVETVYKKIPVKKFLMRVGKMVESICPAHVQLKLNLTLEEECVLGNATQMNQVLLNICANGIHAIGRKEGKLEINAFCIKREMLETMPYLTGSSIPEEWDRYIQIDIKDNGCGMEKEVLNQIFTPFFTTKKAGEGTGLGLALAEQIVLSHKGYIAAESVPQKGSTFHLFLPVLEEKKEIALVQNRPEKLKIAVADDNAKILKMLEKNFEKLNVTISTCQTPEEVTAILKEQEPEILVIDESLEKTNGLDYCMSIQGKYPDTLKIIMTDYVTKEMVEAKQRNLIDDYLVKPVSDTTILEVIMKHHRLS